jgi:YD repeat-containing protein
MISSTNQRGKTTTYAYDPAGNQLSVTDPLGRVTTSSFDADGRRTASVDPRGNYEDCRSDNYGPRCVRDVFFSTIGIIGASGAAYTILGGPANQALFALVDYTTDFAIQQLGVAGEANDALAKKAELRQFNRNGFEGPGSVRYWDGLPYWHAKGTGEFWTAAGNKGA